MLQWFVVSYSLVFAAMLLPAGLLGDRYGRKKLLLVALVVFGVASLACAYSTSAGELIAARALLGLGAAFIVPLSVAVIPVLFSEEERQRAITVVMGMTMVAYPDRADPRRLAAHPLLVGLGVSHQRAGDRRGAGRRGPAHARIAQRRARPRSTTSACCCRASG